MKRKGMGKGLGQGYKNIAPLDSHVHSLSAKGVKYYKISGNIALQPTTEPLKVNMRMGEIEAGKMGGFQVEKGHLKYTPFVFIEDFDKKITGIADNKDHPDYLPMIDEETGEVMPLYKKEQPGNCEWCYSKGGKVYPGSPKKKVVYGLGFHGGIDLCRKCIKESNVRQLKKKERRLYEVTWGKGYSEPGTKKVTVDFFDVERGFDTDTIEKINSLKVGQKKDVSDHPLSGRGQGTEIFVNRLNAKGEYQVDFGGGHKVIVEATSRDSAMQRARDKLSKENRYNFDVRRKSGGRILNVKKMKLNAKAKYITLLNRASKVTLRTEWKKLNFNEKKFIKQGVDRMLANDYSKGGYGGKYKKYILEGGKLPDLGE